jgi:O-antigen ligase
MLMPSAYITIYISTLIVYFCTFFFINKIKIKIFFTDYLVFIFFISSIISTIIRYEDSDYIVLAKSFADIRFALLFLLIRNLFNNKIIKINTLLKFSFFCTIFLSLDIFLQFFYGKDIFGYPEINGRYSGVFGDEAIAGSYIQKFSIFAILATIYLKHNNIFNKEKFLFSIIIILGTGILLTLDRIPFFIYILLLSLLFILIKNFRKVIFLCIIAIIIIFFLFYENNILIKNRYQPLIKFAEVILVKSTNILNINQNIKESNINFNETTMHTGIEYYLLFDSAIYTFKNNFWIGTGRKSYYKSCDNLKKYRKDLLCAPHPHNIYLEILIYQGFFGLLIFIIFLIMLVKKFYYDLIIHKNNKTNKILVISLIILFICELWPLRSYGSIFQTVNGTFFWFMLSIISSKIFIKKNIY